MGVTYPRSQKAAVGQNLQRAKEEDRDQQSEKAKESLCQHGQQSNMNTVGVSERGIGQGCERKAQRPPARCETDSLWKTLNTSEKKMKEAKVKKDREGISARQRLKPQRPDFCRQLPHRRARVLLSCVHEKGVGGAGVVPLGARV
jgi:hypothetical protein